MSIPPDNSAEKFSLLAWVGALGVLLLVLFFFSQQGTRTPAVTQTQFEEATTVLNRCLEQAQTDLEVCANTLMELMETLPPPTEEQKDKRQLLQIRVQQLRTIAQRPPR